MVMAIPQHEYKVGLHGYGKREEEAIEDLYRNLKRHANFALTYLISMN